MKTFKSPVVNVDRSAESFFNKVKNLNNLKEVMPSSIENFESTENTCCLKIKGMPTLNLEIIEKIPYSKVSLAAKDSKIPFSLNCIIIEKENHCAISLEIHAELNMMMEMMVKKPLTQLLDALAEKMKDI